MNKRLETLQVIVVTLCIVALLMFVKVANVWRSIETARLNSKVGVECRAIDHEWLGDGYSMTVVCRLPGGGE